MKAPFLGQAYASRSNILSSQSAINVYLELTEGNSQAVGGFYGTPGLKSVFHGAGGVRGMHSTGDMLFVVTGSTVYRLTPGYIATNLGTLPNGLEPVSIVDNGSQVAIAHQDGWHYVAINGTAIAPVTGAPKSAVLTTQDNYVLFTKDIGGQFGLTALGDLSTIDPLDVATAEGLPDDLIAILSDHREAWLYGTETVEIWSNTGAQFFPFERAPGGFIEQGCAAKRTPCKMGNSVFWLSRDTNGQGIVVQANSYIPVRISTHPIETAIASYGDISTATGFAYQDEGHQFYALTFPSSGVTWVYDLATKMWHQRMYMESTGLLGRHRAACYEFFNGKHIVGDYANGKLYEMDLDTGTDDGKAIYRERAFDLPDSENKRIRVDRVELTAFTGDGGATVNGAAAGGLFGNVFGNLFGNLFGGNNQSVSEEPIVWLQVSRDAGRTFGNQRFASLGALGKYMARVRWRRCGYGRSLVLRIATTMGSKVQWCDVNVVGEEYDA